MTKGKIFLVPFPYDDLSANKLRPALCLTNPLGARRHVILAYITSRISTTLLETDIELDTHNADFAASGLRVPSTVVIHRELGELSSDTLAQIAQKLSNLLLE